MPIARIQLPDGRIGRFEVPEGTTPDQVVSYAQNMQQQEQPGTNSVSPEQPQITPAYGESTMGGIETKVPDLPSSETFVRPLLEAGGAAAGGLVGSGLGMGGTIAGGALGYAGGKNAADLIYNKEEPQGVGQALYKTAKDVSTGATMEMAGPVIGKTVGAVVKPVAKTVREILGASTGAGPGMIDEAIKGSRSFKRSMRGQKSGQEVVDTAFDALQKIKDKRLFDYQKSLEKIAPIERSLDTTPINKTMTNLFKKYNIRVAEDGTIDVSRIAMGKKGRNDIAEIIDEIAKWGSKEGDNSALGLDVLKRQLDDFYSDSSQARGFVSSLRNAVKETITKEVHEYGKMTAKYAEATKLIKDIESNLMMRKQGISGRITPDQTLRRLTSAMRENFELRRELIDALGKEGGENVAGEIAGYTASQVIPRGLVGKLAGSSAGYLTFINPKFLPLLAASSPRVVGEFLNIYGKGLRQFYNVSPALIKTMAYKGTKTFEDALNSESAMELQPSH